MIIQIFITGKPGIGKTTLIKDIINTLNKEKVPHQGFITQEIREKGKRVGFSYKTTENKTGTLAHIRFTATPFRVGKYGVFIQSFEDDVLFLLNNSEYLIIIDEIGKMELFSREFERKVMSLFFSDQSIIATIGLSCIHLFKKIKLQKPQIKLMELTRENFSDLKHQILFRIKENL
jgi:nucleoside-triphosphatase